MHDPELYDSHHVILSLSCLSSLLSLSTRSTSNIIYDWCSCNTQVFRIFFVSRIINSIFLNNSSTFFALFYFENIYSSIIDVLIFILFTMRTNSTVSNNESDSTIAIINDDYPRVIKEVFLNTMLLT
jgi:hypothetical protein